jgi:hypothetical protein
MELHGAHGPPLSAILGRRKKLGLETSENGAIIVFPFFFFFPAQDYIILYEVLRT